MLKKSWLMIHGTQFRIWATQRLREYLIKGFALDDQRLKQAAGGNYFDELLARNCDAFGDREIGSKMYLVPFVLRSLWTQAVRHEGLIQTW